MTTNTQKTSKVMNAALWIAQVILAAGFFWAGSMKLFQPAEKLSQMWPWTADHPHLVILTGILDLLAGIGLIFPMLLRLRSELTIYAAYGTIALMIAAILFHFLRGEASQTGVNFFFIAFAIFIVWGRQKNADK